MPGAKETIKTTIAVSCTGGEYEYSSSWFGLMDFSGYGKKQNNDNPTGAAIGKIQDSGKGIY
jgi:hypothetical protein